MIVAISCGMMRNHGESGDFLYNDYTEYFSKKGATLVTVSNACKDPAGYVENFRVEGLILSGGNDIGSEPIRDTVEYELLRYAIERDVPVFGICRGMQFINYYFSGTKPSDIEGLGLDASAHIARDHELTVADKSWAEIFRRDKIVTNSYHRQGFLRDMISNDLAIAAFSNDGIVEAVVHKKHRIIGIQWHPERKSPDEAVNDVICDMFLKQINKGR